HRPCGHNSFRSCSSLPISWRCLRTTSVPLGNSLHRGTVLAKAASHALCDAIPDIPSTVLQQALDEYPDLDDVDEEHVEMWMASTKSLLKLTDEDVQSSLRRHPWLLLADPGTMRTRVTALSRVLSAEESQVARAAVSHPDVLELSPMHVMEQLLYVSGTTALSYDTVVALALSCPTLMCAEP
ncbi:hypothetical protein Agub_g10803, partial [Astrephomene gubernaculifera]